MASTDAAAAAPQQPENPSVPPATNQASDAAPAATVDPPKQTVAEMKAQKKAEKAAKRAQVVQNRQTGSAAPSAADATQQPQGNKASLKPGKESGKGGKGSSTDLKNIPIRLSQKENNRQSAPVEPPAEDKTVELFRHLYKSRAKTIAGAKDVHPAVLALGQQMNTYVICGSNARLVATLQAFKRVSVHWM